ncbi:hypothetical protein Y032_0001g316 [Ancylostoma ceylanicum]|uniref:Reverse transcriptase domain-containing protein n=2 Tax=Ancylostoma ceylanicum TaxID=53326 RepID=A0A016W5E4_9BILA|nr:hypothetical protein Y032_0001g316 [Ancylostoma ceylanicum]
MDNVPEDLRKLLWEEDFLRHQTPNMHIYYSQEVISMACENGLTAIIGDGVHKLNPMNTPNRMDKGQLYVIHGVVSGGIEVPPLYAITRHKNVATYRTIFGRLREAIPDDRLKIVLDFEKGMWFKWDVRELRTTSAAEAFHSKLRKMVSRRTHPMLEELLECLQELTILALGRLLHVQDGDKEDLENCRPITRLPVLYKVFTRCILTCIRRTLDEAQPVERAGFRRKFSILDHIITCCRLIEVAREYQEALVLAFIDYKKAFDSVEPAKVRKALEEQSVEMRYSKVLNEYFSVCTTVFRPFHDDIEVSLGKGVRQGDPVSLNLFSACSESVIRNCDWSTFGIPIDGKRPIHLASQMTWC